MKKNSLLLIAWIVSIVATGGSLFFSEVMGFIPCTLCWYQRILMYPLTILLGIAYFKKNNGIFLYTLPMTIIGLSISSYHYYLQQFASKGDNGLCQMGCSGKYIDWFGFITIPFMALIAFIIITVIGVVVLKKKN